MSGFEAVKYSRVHKLAKVKYFMVLRLVVAKLLIGGLCGLGSSD
jgi:hypothetical protein